MPRKVFYAMEWVDGESLGALPPREALLLLRAVADALTVLGEQRLVHRDIKPDNIMIARARRAASRVKLIDFGLAKALEHTPDRFDSVDTGERFVGSVYFASPEQIRARGALDCRSDFYSLGATLWHVLAGSPPFTGTTFEVQRAHVEDEPAWDKIAHLAPSILALLERLLAKDPVLRPADAHALLAEWDTALADLEPAQPARPVGDSQPHPIVALPVTVVAVAVDQALPGCDAPPAHARLLRDAASGEWLAVRTVPQGLAPELRAEFLAAARAAQTAPHSGLLNVRDVREDEVISEWPPSVAATRLLAAQQGALPLGVILAWLPKLAKTIDWARDHGLNRLGLDPPRWHVAFESLPENETPSDRAARPPGEWGPHYIFFDPLAGFDPDLAAITTADGRTRLPQAHAALNTPAKSLAALARALHELLGGRDRLRLTPLPALDEARNELLFAAIEHRSNFTNAREWGAAFVECGGAATPLLERAERGGGPDDAPEPRREPAPSPPLRAPPQSGVAAPPHSTARSKKAGLLVLVLIVAGIAAWKFWPEKTQRLDRQPSQVGSLATATKDNPFVNGLGMEFVPVPITGGPTDGKRVLFCVWETRVKDYAEFAKEDTREDKDAKWKDYEYSEWNHEYLREKQGPAHPVVNVSWEDARAFCDWVTKKERAAGRLGANYTYRLPSDHEWSCAVGIGAAEATKAASEPKEKDGNLPDYPWDAEGQQWPPPARFGNFAGQEIRKLSWSPIEGYEDAYAFTAPVGSFATNAMGIFDLSGNVWEWCEDWHDSTRQFRVVRGGSWFIRAPDILRSSYRVNLAPSVRFVFFGFRCVVAGSSSAR